MLNQQYAEYHDTPLWRALERVIADLVASGEVRVETGPGYVVGYMCQELAAKGVAASSALARDR